MEVENMLAKRIGTAGENAPYDNCCKKLLASKQILAWILKTCVLEFKDCYGGCYDNRRDSTV